MPFNAKLDENNRRTVLSKIVPWEEFARLYYKNFKSNWGAHTKDARLVLGVIIIKPIMKVDNRGVIEMIRENPSMQYFLGLEAFTYEQVMTPSLLVSIRKRIDLDVFESLTDDLIGKGLKLKAGPIPDDVGTEVQFDEQDPNNLIVTDTVTGEAIQSYPAKPIKDKTRKRWRIKTEEGKYRTSTRKTSGPR